MQVTRTRTRRTAGSLPHIGVDFGVHDSVAAAVAHKPLRAPRHEYMALINAKTLVLPSFIELGKQSHVISCSQSGGRNVSCHKHGSLRPEFSAYHTHESRITWPRKSAFSRATQTREHRYGLMLVGVVFPLAHQDIAVRTVFDKPLIAWICHGPAATHHLKHASYDTPHGTLVYIPARGVAHQHTCLARCLSEHVRVISKHGSGAALQCAPHV